MFPNAVNLPAFVFQYLRLSTVTLEVNAEFLCPEVTSRTGSDVVIGTAVPEASIDKNGNPLPRKNNIRTSCFRRMVDSIAQTSEPQCFSENAFRRGVATTYPCHKLRAVAGTVSSPPTFSSRGI